MERQRRVDKFNGQRGAVMRPNIVGYVTYYDDNVSKIPDAVRLSFADGTTEVYQKRIKQPAPVVTECIQIIRKWKGYTPPGARKGGSHE